MSEPTRIIDVHQHVFWGGRDDAALVADMDACGIDKAVLLNWDMTSLELTDAYVSAFNPAGAAPGVRHSGLPLSDLVRAARRYPERFVAGYCPHPLDPHAIERLEAAIGMYDVRICGEWKASVHLDDPRCLNLFRFCGEKGLPVLFHLALPYRPDEQGEIIFCTEWYGGTMDNVQNALEGCPETVFIAHGPGFWRHISADAAEAGGGYPGGPVIEGGRVSGLLDACDNLHAELSANSALNALSRDPAFGKAFLLQYHQRLLFGRDTCGTDLHEWLGAQDLPPDAAENIYHRNAEKLLRIP